MGFYTRYYKTADELAVCGGKCTITRCNGNIRRPRTHVAPSKGARAAPTHPGGGTGVGHMAMDGDCV